jgi:DNA primase
VALYTKDSVARVKEAADIVEVVSSRTDLRRVGQRHTGLCPFHDERTASFSVSADLGLYHCFGCGESGDVLRFVEQTEGLDFRQSIELLADRYGVELRREREDPAAEERRTRRERLMALVERTAAYYARYLWESGEAAGARRYLAGRGLGEEVLRGFRVGYAPSAWDKVLVRAQRDGYAVEEIAAAGLGQSGSRGGFYDRFRGRIVFPLADARGRVLGFGARAVREEQRPKYLNTAENEIYHKRRQLFGIDQARGAAARAGLVVAVEGYTDVLALHQAGIPESVAIMGTALTQEQLAELHRAAGTVCLALDADRSGQEAMLRAGRTAQSRGLDLRVVGLPDGRDPAELVAEEGVQAFRALLGSAMSVAEFEVRRVLAAADLDSGAGRDRALAEVRPLIASVEEKTATRDELVRYVADRLDVPTAYLMTQLTAPRGSDNVGGASAVAQAPTGVADAPHGGQGTATPSARDGAAETAGAGAPAPRSRSIEAAMRAEHSFLAMCVAEPRLGREYLERLDDDHLSSATLRRARRHLAEHLDEPLASLPDDDPELEASLRGIMVASDEKPSSESDLRLRFLTLDLTRHNRALNAARDRGDFDRLRDLLGGRERVRAELDTLMGEAV